MPPSRERINDILLAALEREPASRAAFLAGACGGDADLLREVQTLLEADAAAGSFLAQPAVTWTGLVAEPPASLAGRTIGPYRVLEEIGRGGMGVVYRAEDTRLHRTVALKALTPEISGDARRRAWLQREARAAGALSHPGIATVYALEDLDGQLFIAAEFVAGRTLRDTIVPGGLPLGDVVDTALQVARALEAAHARGVVHRDLKPENIVCRPDGTIKLVDFGIASFDDGMAASTRLTQEGPAAGTPAYMSPEQIEGGPVDFRSDLFSFGVVLYEMASGANPFEAATPLATAARVASVDPPPLAAANVAAQPALERIAGRCLMKRRDDRYPSTGALVADLERLRDELRDGARRLPARAMTAMASGVGGPASRASWSACAWWAIHQVVVMVLYAAMMSPIWIVHSWGGGGWPLALVAAYIAVAVANGVLRAHLLFTAQVTPSELPAQLRVSGPWVARTDLALAALLLAAAATAATTGHAPAALLLAAVAVALAAVSLVVEPATTAAAFPPEHGSRRK